MPPCNWNLLPCIVVTTLSLTSCSSDRVPVYPTSGQVLHQGQPAVNALVGLHPVEPTDELQYLRTLGRAGPDGSFQLATYERGDGAPAGKYRVVITWPAPLPGASPTDEDESRARGGPDQLGGRYRDPEQTPLTAVITKGANKLPPFNVE